MTDVPVRVFDPRRLAAVRDTALLDTDPEAAFDRLAEMAASLLGAPFAFVTLVDDSRSFWKSCIGVDATALADRQNPVEESFCQYVIGAQEELIVGDARADPRTRDNPSIERMGVAAWAGFPVRAADGEILGTFCVVDTEVREWSERDVDVLRTLAEAASREIALRTSLERFRSLAETLQETLLPPQLPAVPGLDLAAHHLPAAGGGELVGDFYDVFQSGPERWDMVMGDVCGKGVEAAKLTAFARWTLRAAAMRAHSPSRILATLNEAMLRQRPGGDLFLTAAYVVVTPIADGAVAVMGRAGHPYALLRRVSGEVESVEESGTVLGLFPRVELHDATVHLGPGDALVLFTDGVTESRRDGELFGDERLRVLVGEEADVDAAALVNRIEAAVREWGGPAPADDAAVLVVRVPG